MQKKLNNQQIAAFYNDVFVEQQILHFRKIISRDFSKVIVDVGGGAVFSPELLKMS